VLEQTPPCWKLDRKESTKLSLKYRRGKGEILIVSHGGRGWWDPTSDAKGGDRQTIGAAKRFVALPKQWIVERSIGWLNRCRRLAKDWENLNLSAFIFLRLASIRLMLRKLCN
jgi:transposase